MPSFRLWTIFYAFALLAAAMATFGPGGIMIAAWPLCFWALVFHTKTRRTFIVWFCLLSLLILAPALLLPAIASPREAARRNMCMNNLKQIQLGILNYEAAKRVMPPAYVADAQGKPKHSWRVMILPFLGETALFSRYNLNEPWNGPNNSKLAQAMPDVYRCPGHSKGKAPAGETQYFAVVGPQAAWLGSRGRPIRQFTDGTSKTIMVIEASGMGINWMDPRDVSLDEALKLLTTTTRSGHQHVADGLLTTTYYETAFRNVVFCDGHVSWIGQYKDAEYAKALLTAGGGEMISLQTEGPVRFDDPYVEAVSTTVIKWGAVWSLTVFVVLAPLPVIWIERSGVGAGGSEVKEEGNAGDEAVGVAADATSAI